MLHLKKKLQRIEPWTRSRTFKSCLDASDEKPEMLTFKRLSIAPYQSSFGGTMLKHEHAPVD
jgi:hypothetical protein